MGPHTSTRHTSTRVDVSGACVRGGVRGSAAAAQRRGACCVSCVDSGHHRNGAVSWSCFVRSALSAQRDDKPERSPPMRSGAWRGTGVGARALVVRTGAVGGADRGMGYGLRRDLMRVFFGFSRTCSLGLLGVGVRGGHKPLFKALCTESAVVVMGCASSFLFPEVSSTCVCSHVCVYSIYAYQICYVRSVRTYICASVCAHVHMYRSVHMYM